MGQRPLLVIDHSMHLERMAGEPEGKSVSAIPPCPIPYVVQFDARPLGPLSDQPSGLYVISDYSAWWKARARDVLDLLTNTHIHGTADWNDRVLALRLAVSDAK